METIEKLISRITPPDKNAEKEAKRCWDSIAKPLGSLGLMEDMIIKIAALRGNAGIKLADRRLLVFCADNGLVARGVTQCGSEVTGKVAAALAEGRSSVSPMARMSACRVIPVDMGMRDFPGHPGVENRRIRNGTADICRGPAMSRAECRRALETGAALAGQCAEEGADILLIGEMGIGNSSTAAAVSAVLLNVPPENAAGRGAGLSEEGLRRKRQAVAQAIAYNRPDPADPEEVLQTVGGLDLAAMCGAYIGAAAYRIPAVIDGFISAAAALCALRMCPAAGKAMLASHVSAEPAGRMLMNALGLEAPIHAGMRLGEGSGAVMMLPMLDLALSVYSSGQSFGRLGIEAYTPQK